MRGTIVLGCTAVVIAGGMLRRLTPSAPVPLTSVALVDDMLQPIPGGIVNLQVPGDEGVTLVTDAFGQTRWIGMDPSGGVLLSIADNAVDDIETEFFQFLAWRFEIVFDLAEGKLVIGRFVPVRIVVDRMEHEAMFPSGIFPVLPCGDGYSFHIISCSSWLRSAR